MKFSLIFASAIASASAFPQAAVDTRAQGLGISAARAAEVKNAFAKSKIMPDVVPAIDPKVDFKLAYGAKQMNLGTVHSTAETLQDPTYAFTGEVDYDPAKTKYTLIYVDPDAPGPELPVLRQFMHKIEYNVQPECIKNQSPTTLAPYMPLTPLSVAVHRYTYLVYRQTQPNFKPTIDPVLLAARAPFHLDDFVKKYGLVLVGGNFMTEGLGTVVPS